jgi:hypothetical protein
MHRSLATAVALPAALLAVELVTAAAVPAWTSSARAQGASPQCSDFQGLTAEAQKRASAVQTAMKNKVDRQEICKLMKTFVSAEASVIKFLEANKTWCGVPDQAIASSKTNHERSLKFETAACSTEGPQQQKPPTLSDAMKMPSVDSATNTKTGRGTFDTLTGNPLSR